MVDLHSDALRVRPFGSADRTVVLRLLSASLGWVPDELFDRFFAWKHEQNPFGASPAWVAVDGEEVVGFRTFLRWGLEGPGRPTVRAVRAVDTATHPDHQGRGVFRRLTLAALDELRADGVDLVFNTPNTRSRPGYLKMGWTEVGRPPAAVRLVSPRAAPRMARSRVPAEFWSTPSDAGVPAPELLGRPEVDGLLASLPSPTGLRTRRTQAHLQWRYGFEPLDYRAVALAGDPGRGIAVFRVRGRGDALECALCELLVPSGDASAAVALERQVARVSGADYVIRLGGSVVDRAGFVRLPGQGPVLTRRTLVNHTDGLSVDDWDLSLGDVELF